MLDFTKAQAKIIREICSYQLLSLKRLYNGEDHSDEDIIMYLIKNEVSQVEFRESLEKSIECFEQVHNDPADLRILDDEDISMFRHLLTNLEDEYKDEYPNAIKNLWSRLFILEDKKKNPSLVLQMN